MTDKNQITTGRNDLGLIESSHIHLFCRKSGIGKEAIDHIYSKVGEAITGVSNKRVFGFNEAYDWQVVNEPEAISIFAEKNGIGQILSNLTVKNADNEIFCTMPTGLNLLIVNQKNPDEYACEPVYCKCPYDQEQFVRFKMLSAASQVKQHFPKYYWRLLDYMDNCNATAATLFVYHPLFPDGGQTHQISFRATLVWEDLYFLKERKAKAAHIYSNVLKEMQSSLPLA
jgi:hypothetical protein